MSRTTTDFFGFLGIWYPLQIAPGFERLVCMCQWYVPLRTLLDFKGPGSILQGVPPPDVSGFS
jgi:hypothetical protein